MKDHFTAAIEALRIARAELRHFGDDDHADEIDEMISALIDPDTGEPSDNMTDAEADADTLASAGMGTDEDYGYYGGGDE